MAIEESKVQGSLIACVDSSGYLEPVIQHAIWWNSQISVSGIVVANVSDLRCFDQPVVNELGGALGVQPFQGLVAELQRIESMRVETIRSRATALMEASGGGIRWRFDNRMGVPADVIQPFQSCALGVVLGKRGDGYGYASEHLGSNLDRILRSSQLPCLISSRQFRPLSSILIAYDGSESIENGLRHFVAFRDIRSLAVRLIHVREGSGQHSDEIAARMHAHVDALRAAGCLSVEADVMDGDVEDRVSDFVSRHDIGMLVLGARGHSRLRKLFVGSTTVELVRRCRIPILTFR